MKKTTSKQELKQSGSPWIELNLPEENDGDHDNLYGSIIAIVVGCLYDHGSDADSSKAQFIHVDTIQST